MENNILEIAVNETVKAVEQFGQGGQGKKPMTLDQKMRGIAGTLHIMKKEDLAIIPEVAWNLSEKTGLPTVIVVRAPKET